MTDRNLRGPRPIRPEELGDGDYRELRDAMDAGRRLDASIEDVAARAPEGFTGRVMAAIAEEPVPGSVGFMTPLRRRGLVAGFGESVRRAWAAIGAPGLPSFARATALAYVLVVALAGVALAGAATIGVGSALGVFGPTSNMPVPSVPVTPIPDESGLPTPGPETAPAETEAGESDEPSGDPEASDDHGGPEPSDDHGDDDHASSEPGSSSGSGSDDHSGPGSSSGSDDGSGSGSGSGSSETSSPRPSNTPRPTGTPKPSETPH